MNPDNTETQPQYQQSYQQNTMPQQRDWLVTLLFSIFLGCYGVDRFYTGHIALGVLKLVSLGGCGIWWIIDIILIATDQFKDVEGRPLIKR